MAAEASTGWVDNHTFGQTIQQLCKTGRTGTLFCTTRDSASATIGLRDGVVVALSYKTLRGNAALPALAALKQCRYSFKDKVLLQIDAELAGSDVILDALCTPADDGPADSLNTADAAATLQTLAASVPAAIAPEPAAIAPEPAAIAPEPAAIVSQTALDSLATLAQSVNADHEPAAAGLSVTVKELRDIVIDEATDLFGPIGYALVKEQFEKTGRLRNRADLIQLLNDVVVSTGDPSQMDIFTANVMRRVDS